MLDNVHTIVPPIVDIIKLFFISIVEFLEEMPLVCVYIWTKTVAQSEMKKIMKGKQKPSTHLCSTFEIEYKWPISSVHPTD